MIFHVDNLNCCRTLSERLKEEIGKKGELEKVWYSSTGNTGKGICLGVAMDWIKKIARDGLDVEAEGLVVRRRCGRF